MHYLDIARRGYSGTDMAFFPLYPLLIRIAGGAIGNYLVGGLLISNAALFFGLLFFYKLVEHQWDRAVALRAIFYVSIFPTAIFLPSSALLVQCSSHGIALDQSRRLLLGGS